MRKVISNTQLPFYLLVIVTAVSGCLYWYFQPLCEPCLPGSPCPHCVSDEQYDIVCVMVFIDIALLIRVLYFFLRKNV
jgi:hypothetical protein